MTAPTIAAVQAAVAAHYGLERADLTGPSKLRRHAQPRQVAIYLARSLTARSTTIVGREFGGRDHSTVLASVKRVEARMSDPAVQHDLAAIREGLSA